VKKDNKEDKRREESESIRPIDREKEGEKRKRNKVR
jgi:hypothetical protein